MGNELQSRGAGKGGDHKLQSGGGGCGMGAAMGSAGKGGVAYKTQLCVYYQRGFCRAEYNCNFAHGDHELQSRGAGKGDGHELQNGSDGCGIVAAMGDVGKGGAGYKTQLCVNYIKGSCRAEDNCNFAHGDHELQSRGAGKGGGHELQNRSGGCGIVAAMGDVGKGGAGYKTKLCVDYIKGSCRAEDNCNFAHGDHELQSRGAGKGGGHELQNGGGGCGIGAAMGDVGKGGAGYKKQLCVHYLKGTCRAGDNCYFAHGDHELQSRGAGKGGGHELQNGGGGCGMGAAMGSAGKGGAAYKTQLCLHYLKGFCRAEGNCNYAHGDHKLQSRGGGCGMGAAIGGAGKGGDHELQSGGGGSSQGAAVRNAGNYWHTNTRVRASVGVGRAEFGRAESSANQSTSRVVPSQSCQQAKSIAQALLGLWKDVNARMGEIDGADSSTCVEEDMLLTMIHRSGPIEAVFPVYGPVKAGKSTFLSAVMRETILPAQALPMTSIPIKITHITGASKRLTLKQADKWASCLASFKQKLIVGALPNEIHRGEGDENLYCIQEKIRQGVVRLPAESRADRDIASTLETLSHFVRLLWMNNIDFEEEFQISLKVEDLPQVQLDMKAFRGGPAQHFSLLDTPGPNEAKAVAALRKIGPQMMSGSSGCIFCVPWDQVGAEQTEELYSQINIYMGDKTVIVIITKMDSFKDTDENISGIKDTLVSYFNENVKDKLRIHFTSGHELLTMFELQHLLEKEMGSPDTFKDKLMNSGKLWDALCKAYKLQITMWLGSGADCYDTCEKLLTAQLAQLNAAAVIQDLRDLYADSERLALYSDVANIRNSVFLLKKSKCELQRYASAGHQERLIIQERHQAIEHLYGSVLMELEQIPDRVEREIEMLLTNKVIGPLKEWATTNKDWQVIEVDADEVAAAERAGAPPDDEMEQRLRVAGAKKGQITCSLSWNTDDDLDLHCITPSGAEIYFGHKKCEGGELDVDMNAGNIVPNPVENIYFATPARGRYRFFVQNYKKRTPQTTPTPFKVRLTRAGRWEDKQFTSTAQGQDIISFEFDWGGSSASGGTDGQPPASIAFTAGKAELLQWLRREAEPKFGRVMKKKFNEIMSGDDGGVAAMTKCIETHWASCTILLDKLLELGDETESQFIEFRAVPHVSLNVTELSNHICRFDVADITYLSDRNQVVLVNDVFKRDVLKCFNKTADQATEQIKQHIGAALQGTLPKFVQRVATAKANAVNIRERSQEILNAKTSRKDVEDMVERIELRLVDIERKIAKLQADIGA